MLALLTTFTCRQVSLHRLFIAAEPEHWLHRLCVGDVIHSTYNPGYDVLRIQPAAAEPSQSVTWCSPNLDKEQQWIIEWWRLTINDDGFVTNGISSIDSRTYWKKCWWWGFLPLSLSFPFVGLASHWGHPPTPHLHHFARESWLEAVQHFYRQRLNVLHRPTPSRGKITCRFARLPAARWGRVRYLPGTCRDRADCARARVVCWATRRVHWLHGGVGRETLVTHVYSEIDPATGARYPG